MIPGRTVTARQKVGRQIGVAFPESYRINPLDSDYVVGDDWQGMTAQADIQALNLFGVNDALGCFGDIWTNNRVTLVTNDPTFVKCVKTSWPLCATGSYITHSKAFPSTQGRVWGRFAYKFVGGYTSAGAQPQPSDNSQKFNFFTWSGATGRMGMQFANTTNYHLDSNQAGLGEVGTLMSGSLLGLAGDQQWGSVGTEWTDGEWYEYVFYYERVHSVANGRAHFTWFRRRLTSAGLINPGSWTIQGTTKDHRSGNTPAPANAMALLNNRNQSIDDEFDILLGPWVTRNSADPFGLASLVTTTLGQQPRPTSTIDAGSWTRFSGGGADLHTALNKVTQSDTDYVKVTYGSAETHTFKVRLASHNDPATGLQHVIRGRLGRDGGTWTGSATIKIIEGANTRSTDTFTVTVPANGFITQAFTLSTAEANSITAYTALDVEVSITSGSGDSGEFRVSFVPWEIPN